MDTLLAGEIVALLERRSIPLWAVADLALYRTTFPELPWPFPGQLPRAVVVVAPMLSGVLDSLEGKPNLAYLHHYRQLNNLLDRVAYEASLLLERKGFSALPIAASQTLDSEDLTAHVSHRHLGYCAGMGWRGKNNLLVNPRFGCRFRLVSVLTDAPLDAGRPLGGGGCGACTLCRDACPAGAIGDCATQFRLDLCHAQLSEFRKIPRLGQRICGLCQKACPRGGRGSTEPLEESAAVNPVLPW
ncbi:MAG: epoxyqueuosine reductase [Deltaproteobacteria bacterium]|nr:epoxyqueuosine reductase [Deltaproteobacteria bacterium]